MTGSSRRGLAAASSSSPTPPRWLAIALTTITIPAAVAWFVPVTLIKLLLGHLLPGEEIR